MPSNKGLSGWDDAVELVDTPSSSNGVEAPKTDPPKYTPPRTGRATEFGGSATTPLIENSEDPELTEEEAIRVARTAQFLARFTIGAFLYIVQAVVVGIAASGMSDLDYVPEDAQMAMYASPLLIICFCAFLTDQSHLAGSWLLPAS